MCHPNHKIPSACNPYTHPVDSLLESWNVKRTVFEVDPVFRCVYLLLYATCLSWCSSCNRSVLCTFSRRRPRRSRSTLYFFSRVQWRLYPLQSRFIQSCCRSTTLHKSLCISIRCDCQRRLRSRSLGRRRYVDRRALPFTRRYSPPSFSSSFPSSVFNFFFLSFFSLPFLERHNSCFLLAHFLTVGKKKFQKFLQKTKKKMLKLHGFNLHGETVAITSRIIDDLEREAEEKESEEVDEKSSFEKG